MFFFLHEFVFFSWGEVEQLADIADRMMSYIMTSMRWLQYMYIIVHEEVGVVASHHSIYRKEVDGRYYAVIRWVMGNTDAQISSTIQCWKKMNKRKKIHNP